MVFRLLTIQSPFRLLHLPNKQLIHILSNGTRETKKALARNGTTPVNLKSVYNFMSKFESDQFTNFVFSILNVNSKRRRKKPSLLILERYKLDLAILSLSLTQRTLKRRRRGIESS